MAPTKVEKLVRETLGRMPKGNYVWTLPDPPAELPSAYVVEKRTLPTNYLQGYFHGPKATSKDYPALRLACAVLSGRLFAEVRGRRNLTYSVNAPFVERAFSLGGLYVTTTQPDEVLTIMQQQITSLREGTITEDGLDRLVQQFIVTYFLDNETNADQANMLARAELSEDARQAIDKHKVSLAELSMELRQQAALSPGPQVLTPPTEPAGKAPAGMAFPL